MSVKERMDSMLHTIEEMGSEGIEMRELVKVFYDKWGYRLATIKGYVSDLEELADYCGVNQFKKIVYKLLNFIRSTFPEDVIGNVS